MDLWLSIALIMMTISVYTFVVEIYTALFAMTGLTVSKARFQVVSLFTGAGFTTTESEIITINRSRKRIAMICMITGNVINCVIIGLITNVLFNLTDTEAHFSSIVIFIVASIILGLCLLLRIPSVNRAQQAILEKIARSIFKKSNKDNVISLIDYYGKDEIVDVTINRMPNELIGKELREIQFKQNYDANILMIKRKNRSIEVLPSTILNKGDHVVIFGNKREIETLFIQTEKTIMETPQKINQISVIDNIEEKVMAEVEITEIPTILQGKTLVESKIKDQFDLNVILIKRNGKSIDVTKDTTFVVGDKIIIYGKYRIIKGLFSMN